MPHSSSSVSRLFRLGWPQVSIKPCGPLQAPGSGKTDKKGDDKKEKQERNHHHVSSGLSGIKRQVADISRT